MKNKKEKKRLRKKQAAINKKIKKLENTIDDIQDEIDDLNTQYEWITFEILCCDVEPMAAKRKSIE